MSRRLLVHRSPGETRAALVEEGRLIDLEIARDHDPPLLGAVFLGRIRRKYGNRQAFADLGALEALVDLPASRDGPGAVEEGRLVPVQITQEARRGRLARGSVRLALAGPRLVLLPEGRGVSFSKRLKDEKAGGAAREALPADVLREAGVIVRARAAGAAPDALRTEIAQLRETWHALRDSVGAAGGPRRLLAPPAPGVALLRDCVDPAATDIVCNDRHAADALAAFCLGHAFGVDRGDVVSVAALDEAFDAIEEQTEEALARRVPVAGGGTLVIDEAEALTAVDVDVDAGTGVGGSGAKAVNLRAAAEVARQVRVRALGGLTAVDLSGAPRGPALEAIVARMAEAFRGDPMRAEIDSSARFGVLMVSRQWGRRPLSEVLGGPASDRPAAVRESAETVVLRAIRLAGRAARHRPSAALTVHLAPEAERAWHAPHLAPAVAAFETEAGARVVTAAHPDWPRSRVEIETG